MGNPLLGGLRRQHHLALAPFKQTVIHRVDPGHHCGSLNEMRDPFEPAPIGHHLSPVHRSFEEGQLMRCRHGHPQSLNVTPIHQLGGHIDAVGVPGVVIDGARFLEPGAVFCHL